MNKKNIEIFKALLLTTLISCNFNYFGKPKNKANPIDFVKLNGKDCTDSKSCHLSLHENKLNFNTEIFVSKYKSNNQHYYVLTEDCRNGFSNATLILKTYGFDNDFEKTIAEGVSIQEVFLFDLNNDGKEEFFIQTEAGASGAEKMLIAFTVDPKNNTLNEVRFTDLNSVNPERRGYEYFSIKNKRLYMSYPVYKKKDANCCPSGGEKHIEYQIRTSTVYELHPIE